MENSDPVTIGGEFDLLRDPEDLVTANDENQLVALRLRDTFHIREVRSICKLIFSIPM